MNLVILARLLLPEEFGQMTAALVVVGFSIMMCELGVGPALIQQNKLTVEHQKAGYTVAIILGVFATILVYIFSSVFADFMLVPEIDPLLKVLSVSFLFRSLSVLSESRLHRDLMFKEVTIVDSVSYLFGYFLVSILLAIKGYGVWSLVIAFICQSIIRSALFLYLNRENIGVTFCIKSYKLILKFGYLFSITRLANYVATQADNVIIGRGLGSASLGEYGRAYQLMAIPTQLISQVVAKVLFPTMSKLQEDKSRLALQFRRSLCLSAFVSLPISAFFIILAPEIIAVLLGENWSEAVVPFQILSTCLVCRMGYKMADQVAKAVGVLDKRLYIQLIYAFAVGVFSYIGLRYGIKGVAIGVAVAISINYVLTVLLAVNITSISYREIVLAHIPGISVFIACAAICSLTVVPLRSYGASSLLIILLSFTFLLVLLIIVFSKNPKVFGQDIRWMTVLLGDSIFGKYMSRFLGLMK